MHHHSAQHIFNVWFVFFSVVCNDEKCVSLFLSSWIKMWVPSNESLWMKSEDVMRWRENYVSFCFAHCSIWMYTLIGYMEEWSGWCSSIRVDSYSFCLFDDFNLKFYNQWLWYWLDQCTYFLYPLFDDEIAPYSTLHVSYNVKYIIFLSVLITNKWAFIKTISMWSTIGFKIK